MNIELAALPDGDLEAVRAAAVVEQRRREHALLAAKNAALVGRAFFSCPQTESDYWWVYFTFTGVDSQGRAVGWSFQTNAEGETKVSPRAHEALVQASVEITLQEFEAECQVILANLARRLGPPGLK